MASLVERVSGDRCGILPAVTGFAATVGVLLVTLGLFNVGGGPPAPPQSASQLTPASSSSPARSGQVKFGTEPQAKTAAVLDQVHAQSEPITVTIPALDLHADDLVALGLQRNGKIDVPKDNDKVGWYTKGPWPGQAGPAVMGGHVDSDNGPAVFYKLGELRPGDTITVTRADGTAAVFTVYGVEQHTKTQFPTKKVYGATGGRAELRLITCGGTFDEDVQHYRSNIIAYAKLTAAGPAHHETSHD